MKLKLLFCFLFLSQQTLLASAAAVTETDQFLDPTHRPKALQDHIDKTFDKLSKMDKGIWWCAGSKEYNLMFVESHKLVCKIVEEAIARHQEEITIVDIGAGDGRWSKGVAEEINKRFQESVPKLRVHIVSLTGEKYKDESKTEGICTVQTIGAFKIEDLSQGLKKHGLAIENKVDLIVSRLCFVHLHDPVGTFVQAYNLLRPGSGLVVTDGFPVYFEAADYKREPYDLESYYPKRIRTQRMFLEAMQEPFVITTFHAGYANRGIIDRTYKNIYPFIVKRTKTDSLKLPYQYDIIINSEPVNENATGNVATFTKRDVSQSNEGLGQAYGILEGKDYYRSEEFYKWLMSIGERIADR